MADTYLQNNQICPTSSLGTNQTAPPVTPPVTPVAGTPMNVISAESLRPQPVVDIPTKLPTTTPPVTTNTADALLKATQVEDTATQKTANDISSKIYDLLPSLSGQTQALATAQNDAGLPKLKQDLNGINNQITKLQAEMNQDDVSLIANSRAEERRDTLLPFAQMGQAKLAGDAAILRALKSSEIGVLNATALAKQGDITLATDTAKQAVELKYAPYRQAIETYKAQLEALAPILSKDEKEQARQQNLKGQLALKQIDKQEQNDKDIQSAVIDAIANGAPSNIISKAKLAKTPTEAAQILGSYSTANLDAQLKRANIANVYSTITERNKNSGNKLTDAEVSKITATPEYKTINGVLPAIQALKDYRDSIEKYGTYEAANAKGKGEKQASYGNAIAAWKTLAGLGALSGADFGLAENVIPSHSLFARDNKQLSQLDTAITNATSQAENLTKRVVQLYPKSSDLLTQQLSDIKKVSTGTTGINTISNNALLNMLPGSDDNQAFFNK